jgi:Flp pilus assembly protein TadB
MNTKYKKWFEETAADPDRRRAAITDFTKRRAMLFCCALGVTVCAIAMFFAATRSPSSPAVLTVSAALLWIIVVRVDSQRQVLTLIDKYAKDEKPAA